MQSSITFVGSHLYYPKLLFFSTFKPVAVVNTFKHGITHSWSICLLKKIEITELIKHSKTLSSSCHTVSTGFSDLVGLPGYILYGQTAVADRFRLVVQHLLVHDKGSTRVHRLWILPYFSSSVPYVWSV